VLQVSGDVDALIARLKAYNPFVVEVIEYNLEDLYFETGGKGGTRP